jgi:Arc/MetJ-type ribon-helix-helix transcriptional regulator
MKRTTVSLPDDLASAVEREARRRDTSTSEVVRVALIAHLGRKPGRRELPFANLGNSKDPDGSNRVDEILAKEWLPYLESER